MSTAAPAQASENRERLLRAAGELIAHRGIDVPMYLVAERAGVGKGTLHRNFPHRAALLTALAFRSDALLAEVAELSLSDPDDWRALESFIDGAAALIIEHPWIDAVAGWARENPPEGWAPGRWNEPTERLVERARRDGLLRPDIETTDVAFLPTMIASLGFLPEPARSIVIARQRALLLDALRPETTARRPLSAAPLPMTTLAQFIAARRPSAD